MSKIFICHSSRDAAFTLELAHHLKRSVADVYCFEERQRPDEPFDIQCERAVAESDVIVVIVGQVFSEWQGREVKLALEHDRADKAKSFFTLRLRAADGQGPCSIPDEFVALGTRMVIDVHDLGRGPRWCARSILAKLGLPWRSQDGLPLNPNLFDYEKDIIEFYESLLPAFMVPGSGGLAPQVREQVERKLLEGAPPAWPIESLDPGRRLPNPLPPDQIGKFRPTSSRACPKAVTTAPSISLGLSFPEAGPREYLCHPRSLGDGLRVAILVSGGIAPGINAVIDGIVQRHWRYAEAQHSSVGVWGLKNGFRAFDDFPNSWSVLLDSQQRAPNLPNGLVTAHHVAEGGSILGTARVDELLAEDTRIAACKRIVGQLRENHIDILYLIGGDGTMRAAHALWSVAELERQDGPNVGRGLTVVGVPKTMDNDILWMWQSFGLLSAVEKAREVVEHLGTEVLSNPRLCVIQLFGSESGFVVGHTVLASSTGTCALALIPEVPFTMRGIASYLKLKMRAAGQRIPHGIVVMAETAIPLDAAAFVREHPDLGLDDNERSALEEFERTSRRFQGQTNDALRSAGLKIVSRGLLKLLRSPELCFDERCSVKWKKLRVFTNEPRHLVRAVPPSVSDIIVGNRLGTLAVDNAMGGYTDFMISQWLTEYVLVPLPLVVLGRKRTPREGIFWKSVLAKTGQPAVLTDERGTPDRAGGAVETRSAR